MIDPDIFTLPWVLSWCLGLPSSSDWSSNGWSSCVPCVQWSIPGGSLNLLPDGNFDPNSFDDLPYFGLAVNPVDPATVADSLCEGYLEKSFSWETAPVNNPSDTFLQISVTFYGATVYTYYSTGTVTASNDWTDPPDPGTGAPGASHHSETRRYYFDNCSMANIWRDNIVSSSSVSGTPCFEPFATVLPSVYEYPVCNNNQFVGLDVYRRTRYSYAYYGNPQ